jgi:Predicted NAD/FAD-dependent oxidoreductase
VSATAKSVIVIGAGIAGLACAQRLSQRGCNVTVLEKSAGVGGRLATRRIQGTWVDHGTQYFKVKDQRFARFVHQLLDSGVIEPWTTPIYRLLQGKLYPPPMEDCQTRYVCPLGMTAIAKFLAVELQQTKKILNNVRITAAAVSGNRWQLRSDRHELFSADVVVSAVPAPQFLPIFGSALALNPSLLDTVASVQFVPSLAVMAGYSAEQAVPDSWYAVRCQDDPILSWMCLNSRKAGSGEGAPVFVFHSSSSYAQKSLEESNLEMAGKPMLTQLGRLFAQWLETPVWWQVHRWRYALVSEPLSMACLIADKPLPLVCAGDWCGGDNLESAYLSGLTAADAVLDLLSS